MTLISFEEDDDSDEEDLFAVNYEDSDTEELTRCEIEALLAAPCTGLSPEPLPGTAPLRPCDLCRSGHFRFQSTS